MKAQSSILSLFLVAAPLLALGAPAAPAPPVTPDAAPSKAVGTYFFESTTASNGLEVNGFLTLNNGGTVTWADQSDFGLGGFFNSTTHGTWKRTGLDSIEIEGYYYRFDAAGNPLLLIGFSAQGTLSTGQAVATVNAYLPGQNPVTESPAFPGVDSVQITTYRM